jgi:serine/threonine-protein kinase
MMKRNLFVGLAVTAAIVAAAGCSTNSQGASATTSVSASATETPHTVTYSPQVVLPFGDIQPDDLAVDAAGNVYVLDDGHFRVLKLPVQ